jgi:AcrR family transcriptional regulator
VTVKTRRAKAGGPGKRPGPRRGNAKSGSRKAARVDLAVARQDRIKRSARNAQILKEAALDLFSETNFSNVTIKDIADATGLNAALIYYYFKDKEELFIKTVDMVVKRAFDEFQGLREAAASPEDVISRWLDTHIRQFELLRKLVKVSVDYASGGARARAVDQAIRGFYENERSVLLAAVEDGIRRGVFSAVDAEQVVAFISTFLDGVMVRSMILSDFNGQAAIHDLRRFIMAHLYGNRTRGLESQQASVMPPSTSGV